jgi:hypothetical protein
VASPLRLDGHANEMKWLNRLVITTIATLNNENTVQMKPKGKPRAMMQAGEFDNDAEHERQNGGNAGNGTETGNSRCDESSEWLQENYAWLIRRALYACEGWQVAARV